MPKRMETTGWQYSLRTAFVVSTILALWFAYLAKQDAVRRQLVSDIESVGGSVKYDDSIELTLFASQRVTEVMIPHERIADIDARRLKSFPNLSVIGYNGFSSTSTDGLVVEFSDMELQWTNITDELLSQFPTKLER